MASTTCKITQCLLHWRQSMSNKLRCRRESPINLALVAVLLIRQSNIRPAHFKIQTHGAWPRKRLMALLPRISRWSSLVVRSSFTKNATQKNTFQVVHPRRTSVRSVFYSKEELAYKIKTWLYSTLMELWVSSALGAQIMGCSKSDMVPFKVYANSLTNIRSPYSCPMPRSERK